MNQDPAILEEIDLYLTGNMRPEETAAFKDKLISDQGLHDLYLKQKISNDIIIGSRLNDIKSIMDADFKSGKVQNPGGNGKWWLSGLGLMCGIFFIGINYFSQPVKSVIIKKPGIEMPSQVTTNSPGTVIEINSSSENRKAIHPRQEVKYHSPMPVSETQKDPEYTIAGKQEIEIKPPVDVKGKLEINNTVSNNKNSEPALILNEKEKPDNVIQLEKEKEIFNTETVVKKNNSYSFKPEFGETFQIPLEAGTEAEFKVLNRAGIVQYTEKVFGDQSSYWDGRNIQGGISPAGLYIYMIEYPNGKKESGQIIIY